MACLSSRIPYGTKVTAETLARIEAAENVLREAGLEQFRVRHHDRVARIELPREEWSRLLAPRRPGLTAHKIPRVAERFNRPIGLLTYEVFCFMRGVD